MRAYVGWGLLIALCGANAALAVDGVIEINQARAEAGGVTEGDAPGFPVSLQSPGSYRLVGDLVLPNGDTSAIIVASDAVSIDLNGFAIRGPNALTDPSAACSAGGNGRGIHNVGGGAGLTVVNGRIVGTGAGGIDSSGAANRIDRVTVEQACDFGVRVGPRSLVTDSTARLNYGHGFTVDADSIVRGSTALLNGGLGVQAPAGSVSVHGCILNGNEGGGLFGLNAASINHNQVNTNGAIGIRVGIGSLVLGNQVSGHSNTQILGATNVSAQVGSGGNVVTYGAGAGGFFYDVRLTCSLENGSKLCLP